MSEHLVRSDVDGLERLIDLPAPPERVRWRHTRKGSNDFGLVAVLHYAPAVLDDVVKRSAKFDVQPKIRVRAEEIQDLFPSSSHHADADGFVRLEGTTVQPTLFANGQKSSLIHGRATVLTDAGLVYLGLYTM